MPVETYFAALRTVIDTASGVRRLGSAALSLCYVAAGRHDAFFEDGLSPLDYAAATLVVEEAGGIVTGFDGRPVGPSGAVSPPSAVSTPGCSPASPASRRYPARIPRPSAARRW